MIKILKERRVITEEPKELKKNYKEILQTTFVNKLDKLNEMSTFLERQITKLN